MIMLMIQGQTGLIRRKILGFFVILLFVSFAVSLNYKSFEAETFLNQLVNPATGEIDENLAELLRVSCRQDLNSLKEAFDDSNLRLQEKTPSTANGVNAKDDSLAKENIQKLINILHPQLKQAISDCIRNNNLLLEVSGEDGGFTTWYTRYLESPYRLPSVSRRILATESSGNDNITIIIACVVTSAVTFALAFCLFLLCFRGSGVELNDERPLLSLKISEPFGGSSDACAFGSINEQKLESFGNESSLDKKASTNGGAYIESVALQTSLNGKSSFGAVDGAAEVSAKLSDISGNSKLVLPMPPGRVTIVDVPPGLPPLKPPPGRADRLTPEPPTPIKASTSPQPHSPITAGPPSPALITAGLPPPPPANLGPRPPGPPPPPVPYGVKPGVRPPPPPNVGVGPPRPPPPLGGRMPRPPGASQWASGSGDSAYPPKAKLKPFFWDKVAADPDTSVVWNQIKAGSFQFNEEMIETLFGFAAGDKKKESFNQEKLQFMQLIDAKKAQNLSILLKALNVTTEEVCDALREGNELPSELLQTLLKMAPTQEEELKLRLFDGELSKLGPADRFLKAVVEIPFAYKRMEVLLFMSSVYEEVTVVRECFDTLEVACKELRSSRLFLKILEAVLKTGNRMNDGTFRGGAQAFKLDTLLKLSDVKGVDGKITLLHFVVQEIIRTEGLKAARMTRESKSFTSIKSEDLHEDVNPDTEEHYRSLGLQVVSRLSSELENVKKVAAVDPDNLTGTVAKLGHTLLKTRDFLNSEMKSSEEESGFHEALKSFVQGAEDDIMSLLEEEKKVMALVKSTGDYFHGNVKKDEGLRLFSIVRDFLKILDKVCEEIKAAALKKAAERKKQESNASTPSESCLPPDPRQKISPAAAERKGDDSSSSSSSDVESAPKKTAIAHKRQVSNDSASSQSCLPPNPSQKIFPAIAVRKVDDSSSTSDDEGSPVNIATAHIRQMPHAPASSQSHLPPDPRQKVFPAIAGQKLDDSSSSSSFSSDDESDPVKTVIAHNNQVLNASSSSESHLAPDLIQKVFPAISGRKLDESSCGSDDASTPTNTTTTHIRQVSNASSCSESRLKPSSPAAAIAERKVDDSGSSSDFGSYPMKTASAHVRQVSDASSSSESHVKPPSLDPLQKLFPAIAELRVDDSDSSSDDESAPMKIAIEHERQVSNASSSSESRLKSPLDYHQWLFNAIAESRVDASDSSLSSDNES